MADSPQRSELIVVGANHRSSSARLRDIMFVDDAAAPEFLARLRRGGVEQAVVLSTCDRVEVQAASSDPAAAGKAIAGALAESAGLPLAEVAPELYTLAGPAALKHIFAVAASLESQVIGEPQVLGQVKAGHRLARAAGAVGAELEAVLQAAYAAAKRVRGETAVAEGPVSMAAAAVQIARDVHGALDRRKGLLIGDGEMGELMAEQLLGAGLGSLVVAVTGDVRAEALARRLGCHTAPFERFGEALAEADIVIAAAGGRQLLIVAEMVATVLKRRRRSPMFLVDTGVPGDIDPVIARIDQAFLYDLDDLERLAMHGRAGREQAATEAWKIVAAEAASFGRDRDERRAVPAITALRQWFEEARREALAEAGAGGDAGAEEITRRLVNRLLHAPSEVLREIAASGDGGGQVVAEDLIRRLFRLDSEEEKKSKESKT